MIYPIFLISVIIFLAISPLLFRVLSRLSQPDKPKFNLSGHRKHFAMMEELAEIKKKQQIRINRSNGQKFRKRKN